MEKMQIVRCNRVSVVIPVYRNADTVHELYELVSNALERMGVDSELVFVNDACPERSADALGKITQQDPTVKVLSNPENLGQQRSIRRGLSECTGDAVVVMDADLQDPPAAIPAMLTRLSRGDVDAVFVVRTMDYQTRFRMLSSRAYRSLIRRVVRLPYGTGGFVAINAALASRLLSSRNPGFYLAGLIGCHADAIGTVPWERLPRRVGRSAYTERMRVATALSNILCVIREKGRNGTL